MYLEYEKILSLATIAQTASFPDNKIRKRIRHGLIDHYLQRKMMPHETEMQTWSRGATAHVDGEKIRFQEVIAWCQKSSTLLKRQKLQQETGPLCKLLKPFAVNYWTVMQDTLTGELGFDDYIDYCSKKKGIDYSHLYVLVKQLLQETQYYYFHAMEMWSRDQFGLSMDNLSRFDAVYLLSLSSWDHLCSVDHPENTLAFFEHWGIDPLRQPGLHLDIKQAKEKSGQAISLMVRIPQEIYILIRPEGGWIDVETLWHELGHGLSGAFTDPALPVVDRELATAFNLSEVYAFLLQRLALSESVLSTVMGAPAHVIDTINHYKNLKDLAVFRRYAAKFICEYEMFSHGDLSDGGPYAETMAAYTGFYHQPESHLFDLVPEFYCADYLLGWLGEAMLDEYLTRKFGHDWCLNAGAGETLKELWRQGMATEIVSFFEKNSIGKFSAAALRKRWHRLSDKT